MIPEAGEVVPSDDAPEVGEESLWRRILKTEPAMVRGFVTALLVLAVAYGAPISEEQKAATIGAVAAAFALAQAWSTRQVVSSPATVEAIEAAADTDVAAAYWAGVEDAGNGFANIADIG